MKYPKYKKELEYSYVLGTTLVFELLQNRASDAIKIIYSSKLHQELLDKLMTVCHKYQVPLELDDKNVNYLSDKENCYVIGVCKKTYLELNDSNHLLLVNPSNAGNLGTIIRTAMGFNIKNIAVITPCVDLYDPKTIRASMGAIFRMNVSLYNSLEEYLRYHSKHTLYPFMLKAQISLQELKEVKKPYTLVFGNEATGLPDSYLEQGIPVVIKHTKQIDSLNLQTAVSVAVYEFTKIGGDYFD